MTHTPPLFIGKLVYIFTRPIIIVLLHNSHRSYVVVRTKNDIVVTKNWLGMHKVWRLPGGGMKQQEQPLHAACRELQEELGLQLQPKQLRLLEASLHRTKYPKYKYWLYEYELPEKITLKYNKRELIAAQWMPLEQLNTVPLADEIRHVMGLLSKK